MPDAASNVAPPVSEPIMPTASPLPSEGPSGATPLSEPPTGAALAGDSDGGGWAAGVLDQFSAFVDTGGPVVVVLALLSTFALAIVLLKLWQFRRLRLDQREPVASALQHWRRRDARSAHALVAGSPHPVAQLVHIALDGLEKPGIDLALLREELSRVASATMEQLRSYLRALEIVGNLSPLLGLLGTVLGMIEAFRQLEVAGSQVDPAILSGGIWQALLTTAVGLTVAIPVVLAHTWLERRVERCGHQMEDAVTQIFTRDLGLAERRQTPRHNEAPKTEVGYAA